MITVNGKKILFSWFIMVFSMALAGEAARAAKDKIDVHDSQITPAHVYVELMRVEQFIDELGRFMGILEPDPLGISITNASPHDVYFQARTLTLKASRLSFELIRKHRVPQVLAGETIGPAQVKKIIIETLGVMSDLSLEFDLLSEYPKIEFNAAITPSEVFMATLTANRHLNALLERQFSPADAFSVVNLAIGYAATLLAEYPGAERIPKKPLYEKNKKPLDVYSRLLNCFLLINKIYQAKDYDILEIDASGLNERNVCPSDVFDMASLIVARLYFFHKEKSIRKPARESYFPGRKFPSDVYQQAAILEQQLTDLLSYVGKEEQTDK